MIRLKKNLLKKFLVLSFLTLTSACSSPTAFLGPVYTFSTGGTPVQASFNYGTSEVVKKHIENENIKDLRDISLKIEKKENVQKKVLQSERFIKLVKANIKKTKKLINFPDQLN